jgi:hypothetical protein
MIMMRKGQSSNSCGQKKGFDWMTGFGPSLARIRMGSATSGKPREEETSRTRRFLLFKITKKEKR